LGVSLSQAWNTHGKALLSSMEERIALERQNETKEAPHGR
jgi:hypothetical protein